MKKTLELVLETEDARQQFLKSKFPYTLNHNGNYVVELDPDNAQQMLSFVKALEGVKKITLTGLKLNGKKMPKIITVKEAYITNDAGGTEQLPEGEYRVAVTDTWHDYETGNHGKGILIDPKDIEVARKAGTTGYNKKGKFDPSQVFFFLGE